MAAPTPAVVGLSSRLLQAPSEMPQLQAGLETVEVPVGRSYENAGLARQVRPEYPGFVQLGMGSGCECDWTMADAVGDLPMSLAVATGEEILLRG